MVPTPLRAGLVKMAHESAFYGAHSGAKSVFLHLRRYYFWPDMWADIVRVTKECRVCANHAGDAHHGPFSSTPNPPRPFHSISVDTVGPLPETSAGNRYILVAVCNFSRWVVATPVRSADSKTFLSWLVDRVVSVYGPPEEILSDNGSQFKSSLADEALAFLGVARHFTSGYRPNANGACEVQNKYIVARTRAYVEEMGAEWDSGLPMIEWSLRAKVSSPTGLSPYEVLFGRAPRLPGDPVTTPNGRLPGEDLRELQHEYVRKLKWRLGRAYAQAREYSEEAKTKALLSANERRGRFRSFDVGQIVRYRIPVFPKLGARWQGPFKITDKVGEVNYVIEGLEGDLKGVTRLEHVDSLDVFTPTLPPSLAAAPPPAEPKQGPRVEEPQPPVLSSRQHKERAPPVQPSRLHNAEPKEPESSAASREVDQKHLEPGRQEGRGENCSDKQGDAEVRRSSRLQKKGWSLYRDWQD